MHMWSKKVGDSWIFKFEKLEALSTLELVEKQHVRAGVMYARAQSKL